MMAEARCGYILQYVNLSPCANADATHTEIDDQGKVSTAQR
jgi:hypothetical protein